MALGVALPLAGCGLALALRGGLTVCLLIQVTCIPSYRGFRGGVEGTLRRLVRLVLLTSRLLLALGSAASLWVVWRKGDRPQAAWRDLRCPSALLCLSLPRQGTLT